MELSIIVLNYNTVDLLKKCLQSIFFNEHQTPCEVLVVDNNSRDGSAKTVRREFPNVDLIANSTNRGYARAVNQALKVSQGEYILILNADIRLLPGAIDELKKFMDIHQEAGIVGAKLLNPDGTLQYSCRTFYALRTILYRRTILAKLFPQSRIIREHLMTDWDHSDVREVDWVLGSCLMVRREAIRDVGMMDERYFLYFEDVDLCYRMKRGGWKVYYLPQARMIHHHRRDSARKGINRERLSHLISALRFYYKWHRVLPNSQGRNSGSYSPTKIL